MIRNIVTLRESFSRSRLRRNMKVDPKMKDFTQTYDVQKQIKKMRNYFEMEPTQETFSSVLNDPSPKLTHRFEIDRQKLSKKMKAQMNKKIKLENLESVNDDQIDPREHLMGKSFINDQRIEIEFEQKFKKELFMKKQTKRLIEKQKQNPKNYLPSAQTSKFVQYQQKKNQFKNSKIESMMTFKRNNQQLKLLIQSGFVDDPDSLGKVIQKVYSENSQLQRIQGGTGTQIIEIGNDGKPLIEKINEEFAKAMQQESSLTPQIRSPQKLLQFLKIYSQSTESQRQRTHKDLSLLSDIRKYEHSLFQSRYDALNFRFGGRVQFTHMKEEELLSYLKNQKIQPKEMLMMVDQNKEKLSRFDRPVVTPAVMARVYSRTSTYQFPQNQQNNRMNMLADPLFISLERSLFQNLDKLSNSHFIDAVAGYSKNHEQEQGLLKRKMNDKVEETVWKEAIDRISYIQSQADLGLLMRSMTKMGYFTNALYYDKWENMLVSLQPRLQSITNTYAFESIMLFISLIPVNQHSLFLLRDNLPRYLKYEWHRSDIYINFIRVCSCLIRYSSSLTIISRQQMIIWIKGAFFKKEQEIKKIMPHVSINMLPQIITIMQEVSRYQIGNKIPQILVNLNKKLVIDNIRQQKQQFNKQTLPNLCLSIALFDHQTALSTSKFLRKIPHRPSSLVVVPYLSLLPFRVHPHNSTHYLVYHELARMLQSESSFLHGKSLVQCIAALALVGYKNEGLIDVVVKRWYENEENIMGEVQVVWNAEKVRNVVSLIASYGIMRRTTNLIDEMLHNLLPKNATSIAALPPNLLLRFFTSFFNLYTLPTIKTHPNYEICKITISTFLISMKNSIIPLISKLQLQEIVAGYLSIGLASGWIYRSQQTNKQQMLQKCKQLHQSFFSAMQKKNLMSQNNNYLFIVSLTQQILSQTIPKQTYSLLQSFTKFQKIFQENNLQIIQTVEQHMGTPNSYNAIYSKLAAPLKSQHPDLVELPFRLESASSKKVYLICSYEMLMRVTDERGQIKVGLHGLWKAYAQMYKSKGWEVDMILTFKEG